MFEEKYILQNRQPASAFIKWVVERHYTHLTRTEQRGVVKRFDQTVAAQPYDVEATIQVMRILGDVFEFGDPDPETTDPVALAESFLEGAFAPCVDMSTPSTRRPCPHQVAYAEKLFIFDRHEVDPEITKWAERMAETARKKPLTHVPEDMYSRDLELVPVGGGHNDT